MLCGETSICYDTGAALGQLSALVFTQFQLILGTPLPLGALGMLKPLGSSALPGFPGLGKGLGVGLAGLVVVSTGVSK